MIAVLLFSHLTSLSNQSNGRERSSLKCNFEFNPPIVRPARLGIEPLLMRLLLAAS